MNKLVISNLIHRPVRSAISIVAIAVEVTLILLIVGLSVGMLRDSAERTRGIGADVMVSPPGSSFLTGITGAPVSIKVADVLRTVQHVTAVAPVIMQVNTAGAVEVIYGIDLTPGSANNYNNVGTPFHYMAGGPFEGPDDMLVDDYFATQQQVHVGQKLELLNHQFRVSGIVEHGKGARKFLPIKTLQDLIGGQDKASMFYVRLDHPANADAVVAAIKKIPGMERYSVRSLREYLSLMTPGNLPGFSTFINVVIGVAVVIGFIVIFQSMYTAVMERTREIGILKSLGANKAYIVGVIIRETLVLAFAGIVLGILISFAARAGILHRFPQMRVMMDGPWILRAAGIAICGAILGAIYPAYKAAQKDPIDALAYE
jgi:putative ABC transport system permease protein